MKKILVDPYKNVGNQVTEEEYIRRKNRRTLMRELGLIPIGYTTGPIHWPPVKEGRFSKLYETEQELINDKLRALELITDEKEVPQELYDKITKTLTELRPIYGEKYDYIC